MKKCLSIVLVMLLLSVMTVGSVSASEFNLIKNTVYDTPLINAIANVQTVSADMVEDVLTGEKAPGIALVNVAELSDVTAFMRLCDENNVVPTFRASTNEEAQKVIDAIAELSCKDVTVISSVPTVLKYVRNKRVIVRTGLEIELESDTLTSDEAHAIRTSVRSSPATFCVIDAAFASKAVVSELQELAVAVWVQAEGNDVSILKAITSGANGVITDDAHATATLMNTVFEENTMTRTPVMIGHRGNPTRAPENSLSSFLKAYENGADVFEIDVEITKDGELIIMHDNTLNRTTNYSGAATIKDMTLEEIKSYRLLALDGTLSEEQVPTFREVLETFKDKDCRIFIEFKGYNQQNVPAALKLVKEFGMEDRVDVISFNGNFLTQTQKESEGMSTGFLHSPTGANLNALLALEAFYASLPDVQAVGSTINPSHGVVNDHYMQAATDRGMTVWPWTYSKSSANMAFLICPDGITTDDVQWSKDMLKYIEADSRVKAAPGKTVPLAVNGTTYSRATSEIDLAECIVKVIEGDDVVRVENGELIANANGTAQVLVGFKTATADDSAYVLYTQPITVEVTWFTPVGIAIAVAALIVLAGTVVVIFVLKKK